MVEHIVKDGIHMFNNVSPLSSLGGEYMSNIVLKRLIDNSRKILDRVLPGVMPRLDWHFYRLYGKPFVEYLLENPEETVNILLDIYGGNTLQNSEYARYVLYNVLRTLFTANKRMADEAFHCILNCEWDRFREVVNKYLELLSGVR